MQHASCGSWWNGSILPQLEFILAVSWTVSPSPYAAIHPDDPAAASFIRVDIPNEALLDAASVTIIPEVFAELHRVLLQT